MARQKILVIDDETDLLDLVRYNLSKDGFDVESAESAEDGLAQARTLDPDLILLDLMLPGMSGLDACRLLKQSDKTRAIPVVFLTARGEESDIVAGLELGAYDYISKPFSPRVLVARVRAVLRRQVDTLDDSSPIQVNGFDINPRRHQARVDGAELDLTATEFKMLHFLALNRGCVFTRSQLVDAVHGEDYPVTDRSVDVQMVGLRRKLGARCASIETVRGVGYRFKTDEAGCVE